MAKKTETQDKSAEITRTNAFFIPPELLVMNEELQGRAKPISQQQIEERAHSIKEHGQLQPIGVRKVKDTHEVVYGFTRAKAILWGNQTGLFSPPLKVLCITKTVNDEKSFQMNIVENLERNNTTPLDDAHNQNKLREQYGWKDADIAKLYKCSQTRVGQLKKILLLDKDTQNKIHEGVLPLSAGLLLAEADIPKGEIKEVIKVSTENGKVNTTTLKQTLRGMQKELPETDEDTDDGEYDPMDYPAHDPADGEVDILSGPPSKPQKPKQPKAKPDEKPVAKYPRTMKEIKGFWNEQAGIVDPPGVGDFAKKMVQFLEGSISEKQMENAFDKLTKTLAGE